MAITAEPKAAATTTKPLVLVFWGLDSLSVGCDGAAGARWARNLRASVTVFSMGSMIVSSLGRIVRALAELIFGSVQGLQTAADVAPHAASSTIQDLGNLAFGAALKVPEHDGSPLPRRKSIKPVEDRFPEVAVLFQALALVAAS